MNEPTDLLMSDLFFRAESISFITALPQTAISAWPDRALRCSGFDRPKPTALGMLKCF